MNCSQVSTIWDKITNTLEGQFDDSGAFHTSDWKLYKNTITKLMCDKFGATKAHTNKGSVLTFSPDKLAKIYKSYNTEIKIKTTLKAVMENEGNSASEMSRNYDNNSNPENDGDGSEGYDGSRHSASDIIDNGAVVVTTSNQQQIRSNTIDKGQGAIPGAVTAVTAVTSAESGNNTTDTQVSPPPTTALQQTRSETKQNAGNVYMSGANWYCRQCKLFGDKFYMEVHICKGYIHI